MYQMKGYLDYLHYLQYCSKCPIFVQSKYIMLVEAFLCSVLDWSCKPGVVTRGRGFDAYEGGSESSVIGVITLLIYMIGCCIIP